MVEKINKRKNDLKNICLFLFLIGLYFALQLKFINDMWFGTDELDIMVLGKAIARGRLLYVDIFSQHMPISYYISALFYKLGAISVTEQRIAFYLFFAIMWASIVFLYQNVIDYRALMIYPIFHCCLIQSYDLGTAILSEHIAGCGAIIIILEFLSFVKTKKINTKSNIFLSFGIVLTFGTIFVSIYALFFVFIGVLCLELKWKTKEETTKNWLKFILKRYVKLGIVVAIPWLVLLVFFVCTHSLKEFVYGAYTINRTIYPRYNGGTGNNILTMFFVPIDMFSTFITDGLNLANWSYVNVLQWIVMIGCLIFLCLMANKYGKLVAGILFMYIYALGIRGIFNFHGTACVEVLAFTSSYVIVGLCNKKLCSDRQGKSLALGLASAILIISGYTNNISKLTTLNFKEEQTEQSKVITKITDENESVWMAAFDNQDMMLADRIPIGGAVTTPWTWEDFGKKEFKKLKNKSPRVAVLDENHEVWGYNLKDYAPKLIKYIKKNYTQIPGTTTLYVRNDYYNEAMSKIGK